MKKEYPIKYALLPVKENVCDNGRDYDKNVCFIVSKAFVEEEYKKELKDGSINSTYKVCFPHTVKDKLINYLRKTPESTLARDNEMVVSNLYDEYEDAKRKFDIINLCVDYDTLNYYEVIESEILELTKDLGITKEKMNKKQMVKEK